MRWKTKFPASFVASLPAEIACGECGAVQVTIEKDPLAKRVRVRMLNPKPPIIVDLERHAGELVCAQCQTTVPIDLRIFAFVPAKH